MKKTNIAYWVLTGLFAFIMFGSAIPDFLVMPMAVEGFREMGYPAYLVPFLGWAKALGVIAILAPGFPRLKEWAYAGLFFDLLGATYSLMSIGKPFSEWWAMLIFIALGIGSYLYYHKRKALASSLSAEQHSTKKIVSGSALAI